MAAPSDEAGAGQGGAEQSGEQQPVAGLAEAVYGTNANQEAEDQPGREAIRNKNRIARAAGLGRYTGSGQSASWA